MIALETLLMLTTAGLSVAKIIDLTHVHDVNTFMSGSTPHYKHTLLFNGSYLPGVYAEYGTIFTGEHGGTHMDAPRHFHSSGKYLHEIPLEKTIAIGVMIDCSDDVKENSSYVMPLQKLLDWEEGHGRIPDGAAVVINFGWSHRIHDPALYVGDSEPLQYPTVSMEAAEWLLWKRNVMILGTDTMSPDLKEDKHQIHGLFLPNDRVLVENVRDPGRLPPRGFRLHAAPVKFVGSSGGPIRLYAMTLDGEGDLNSAQLLLAPLSILIMTLSILIIVI